jgi:hypothetical protein
MDPNQPTSLMGQNSSKHQQYHGSYNVHQLYQDLYISDMKDEIDAVHNESTGMRQQLLWERQKNKDLSKENNMLKQKLAVYRRIASDATNPGNGKKNKQERMR